MDIDLTKLSTPVLKAIRRVLVNGADAVAAKKSKNLGEELTQLKKREEYRKIVASYGLDFDEDEDYYLSFSLEHLHTTCEKLRLARNEAIAEKFRPMRIPPIVSQGEVDNIGNLREHFKELRNRRDGHNEG